MSLQDLLLLHTLIITSSQAINATKCHILNAKAGKLFKLAMMLEMLDSLIMIAFDDEIGSDSKDDNNSG